MKTPHTQPAAAAAMDVECPWCPGIARIAPCMAGTSDRANFICETCSVEVALAHDPVDGLIAAAA